MDFRWCFFIQTKLLLADLGLNQAIWNGIVWKKSEKFAGFPQKQSKITRWGQKSYVQTRIFTTGIWKIGISVVKK